MRMSRLIGRQVKDVPKDAVTPSHIFLIRGGYIRPVSTGIYSLLPLGRRVTAGALYLPTWTTVRSVIRSPLPRSTLSMATQALIFSPVLSLDISIARKQLGM